MKKLLVSLVALVTTASLIAADAVVPTTTENEKPAELTEETDDAGFHIELSLEVMSDYLWRGQLYCDTPCFMPGVTLSYDTGDFGEFGVSVWSAFSLTHKESVFRRGGHGAQEIDYTLFYNVDLFGFNVEVGHMWYTYPGHAFEGSCDQEVYATVSYENPFLTPSASVYWNYTDSDGNRPSCLYYNFAVSHDFEIGDQLVITPNASLGFGGHAWNSWMCDTPNEDFEKNIGTELTDQTVGVMANYAITENLSVGAQINYTWIPSHTLRRADYMGNGKDQLCWGGVNMTLSF